MSSASTQYPVFQTMAPGPLLPLYWGLLGPRCPCRHGVARTMRCRNLYSFKRSRHSPTLPLVPLQRPLHPRVSLQRPLHSLVSLQRPLSSTSPDSEAGSGRWLYAGLLGLLGLGPKEEVEEEDGLTLAVKRAILAIQVLARSSLSSLCSPVHYSAGTRN